MASNVDYIIVAYKSGADEISALAMTLLGASSEAGVASVIHLVANDETRFSNDMGLNIIQGQGNVGFAQGMALGVAASKAEYVVLVNPDCLPTIYNVKQFLDYLVPDCGIVIPRLLTEKMTFDYHPYENWTFPFQRKPLEIACRYLLPRYATKGRLPGFAKIPGAFLAMEKRVALQLNAPFDAAFFLYAEDRDLTDRARQTDVPVKIAWDVDVVHVGGQSGKTVSTLVGAAKTDGALRIASRRMGRLGVLLCIADMRLTDAIKRVVLRRGEAETSLWAVRRWLESALREPGALSETLIVAGVRDAQGDRNDN